MAEISYPWDGIDIGDALAYAPYFADDWCQMYQDMLAMDGSYGVFPHTANQLEASLTALDSPCIIETGAALVAGQYYRNTAQVAIVIPRPIADIRFDRIVLQRTWATKLTRLARVEGVEAAGAPVALTQTIGTLYEIPIAIVEVPVAGDMAITDDRQMRGWIDMAGRQGGSATDWNLAGTTNYAPGTVMVQCGNVQSDAGGAVGITFPVPFSAVPLVLLTTDDGTSLTAWIGSATVNGWTGGIIVHQANPAAPHVNAVSKTVSWLAIGPE